MTGLDPLAQIHDEVAGRAAGIFLVARRAPGGGGRSWDRMLRYYGLSPLAPEARARAVQERGFSPGAVREEVVSVFAALATWARAELEQLEPGLSVDARAAHIFAEIKEAHRYADPRHPLPLPSGPRSGIVDDEAGARRGRTLH
jgi:hypothetical protein